MSFQTGLSGLSASSRSLDVIGNNIANANTTGMKSSRAEFGDLIAASLGASGGGRGQAGIGVSVAAIAQQFTQGNISTTGNSLDVAINGGGFFQLTQPDGSTAYTRDGAFKLDKDGSIRTNTGAFVMGYPPDAAGNPKTGAIEKLSLPTAKGVPAQATSTISAEFNLDAREPAAATSTPPTPITKYGTSLSVFDQAGVASAVNFYFEKDAAANTWNVYLDPAAASIGSMTFDSAGALTTVTPVAPVTAAGAGLGFDFPAGTFDSNNPNEATGKIQSSITLDLTTSTQFGGNFSVSNLTQDGFASGELTGLSIDPNGIITTRFSNGQTRSNGQIILVDFTNVQGLVPLGGNAWAASFATGTPLPGSPGDGKFGALQSGALEESNVDLTSELVNMMTAQRTYQANAQTIKTQDQIMSTLVNLR